jgi:xanthine dehydrogenase accessory factor
MRDVLADIERWQAAGKRIALATVVSVAGSAPRGVGATLAVNEDGQISGSVSGGCVEPAVIEEGLRALRVGTPKLLQFGITEEQNLEQIGLSCGGEIRVFVQRLDLIKRTALITALHDDAPAVQATIIAAPPHGPLAARLGDSATWLPDAGWPQHTSLGPDGMRDELTAQARQALDRDEPGTHTIQGSDIFFEVYRPLAHLIIVGAGHISIPLTTLAKVLGYHVTVIDARAAFATRERLPDADDLLVEWPDEAMQRLTISAATAVAVLTHDDKFDVPALRVALQRGAGYVGAIGSRATRAKRDERLLESGVTDAQLARIHGPIGLDLGAKSPEEIALAILAEIVAARHGRTARTTTIAG